MSHAGFVHLRVHTAYSLSEGAITVKDLVKQCQGMKLPAVAITDTNNLFGGLEFSVSCADAGVQPIIGCQLGVRRVMVGEQGFGQQREGRTPDPDQVVVLVQNEQGYNNLLKLISKAFLETEAGEEPQISVADLEERNAGLILLTGGPAGAVGRHLAEGQGDHAEAALRRLAEVFEGRTYVELHRHGLEVENRIEGPLIDLAYKLDLPLVATNECFFTDIKMYEAHDALICIAAGAYLSQSERRRLTREHRFKTPQEMQALFADLPEAIDNTLVIAQRCGCMTERRAPLLPSKVQEGQTEQEALRALSKVGMERRLAARWAKDDLPADQREKVAKPYWERLEYELGVIEQMGFCGYFLIVADFIQWAKDHDIPVGPGRGSGAGSVVAWVLTITDLDPLHFGLLFERFLNPERVSMPDFDIDFCQDRREEVIRYVQQEYGRDKVAQIITFGKLQARAALRDVGRVLQMPYGQVDRICKLVPNQPGSMLTIGEALESESEFRRERDSDETAAQMIDIAQKIEGLYRHASTHAAGVVIGDRPLDELVPLYRDPRSDMPVTQFNMKWVEQAGLVKFDFLGLKTLTVLSTAVKLIAQRGIEVDLSVIPCDDPPTFEMLGKGEAIGVFQLESSGMRDVLRNMKPDTLEDLIAVVALYRPGPMDNIPSYIKRKHGEEAPDYLYPTLKPILEETYGIIIYQEQVMQIAQELSGYSLGGADLLRRAMGKKIAAEMDKQRGVFTEGAMAKGVPEKKAVEIFNLVDKFANYGFNKSHAAAYAVVAYQTAYLKANFPVEFIAASMTLDMHITDKLNVFREELLRLGYELLPPDVNKSDAVFSVEDGKVRYALAAVRNVGEAAMQALVDERHAHGPFKSLSDFTNRMDGKTINKRLLENLVKAGALDSLEPNRGRVFEGIETILGHASLAASERDSNQMGMFGGGDEPPEIKLPNAADWPPMEKLSLEFEAIGFYLSAHPLDAYGSSLDRLRVVPSAKLRERVERGGGGMMKLAGTVISRSERTSKSGNRYAFVSFSDATGTFEVTFFSEILGASRELLDSGVPILITIDAQLQDDQLRITAQGCASLDQAVSNSAKRLEIHISDETPIAGLKAAIDGERKGRGEILIVPRFGNQEVEIKLPGGYALSPQLIGALKNIPGLGEVREV